MTVVKYNKVIDADFRLLISHSLGAMKKNVHKIANFLADLLIITRIKGVNGCECPLISPHD